MAYYKLTQSKLDEIEKVLAEVKPYQLKNVANNIYKMNFNRLKEHFLNLYGGNLVLHKMTFNYAHKHAIKDAETTLKLDNAETVGHFYHTLKEKPLLSVSNMLNNEEDIDMKTAYDAKEALYKAQSYLMGYKLGYTDVTLTYPELKDLELLLSLYENDDLFDLIEKYSDI
jgi:hypothetical protein